MPGLARIPWRTDALRRVSSDPTWLREDSAACNDFVAIMRSDAEWEFMLRHHGLLGEMLRLYCFKRRRSRWDGLNHLREPFAHAELIDAPPYSWKALAAIPDATLTEGASLNDFFLPVSRPQRPHRVAGASTAHPILSTDADICKIVLANRTHLSRKFVLLGPW